MSAHHWVLSLIGALGVISAFYPPASVFAFLLLVIALSSLFHLKSSQKRIISGLLCLSLASTCVGLFRFIGGDALQGITEARGRATSKRAVSLLREILFAEDAVRRLALIDPDHNKIGGAGRLGELTGSEPARGEHPLKTPPLSVRLSPRFPTRTGPAAESDGYLLIICVPGKDRAWVTEVTEAVDEEKSEQRWLAYAWPAAEGLAHQTAYFIDEHERILESENMTQGKLRLVGPAHSPACEDALGPESEQHWHPWQGKKPRNFLPGAAPGQHL